MITSLWSCLEIFVLKSEWVALYRCIPITNSLGYLRHRLEVLQHLGVLELVQVVFNPLVSLSTPHLRHHFLVISRGHSLIQGLGAPEL